MSSEPVDLAKTPEFAVEEARHNENVVIFHAVTGPFRPFDPDTAVLEEAYRYHTMLLEGEGSSAAPALGQIWRWNNVVDGTELPVRHERRSLSVGDVVAIRTEGGVWHYHSVEPLGWEGPWDYEIINAALLRGQTFDPFEGL